jgi:hypothetical protein
LNNEKQKDTPTMFKPEPTYSLIPCPTTKQGKFNYHTSNLQSKIRNIASTLSQIFEIKKLLFLWCVSLSFSVTDKVVPCLCVDWQPKSCQLIAAGYGDGERSIKCLVCLA